MMAAGAGGRWWLRLRSGEGVLVLYVADRQIQLIAGHARHARRRTARRPPPDARRPPPWETPP